MRENDVIHKTRSTSRVAKRPIATCKMHKKFGEFRLCDLGIYASEGRDIHTMTYMYASQYLAPLPCRVKVAQAELKLTMALYRACVIGLVKSTDG